MYEMVTVGSIDYVAKFIVPYGSLFLVSLVTVLILTPLAHRIAVALGAVDKPGPRRVNKVPIPRMGGIAVFLGLSAAVVTQWAGTTFLGWPVVLLPNKFSTVNYKLLCVAFLFMFMVGAVDDVKGFRPRVKLLGQTVAATIAVAGGLTVGSIVNPFAHGTEIDLGIWAYPLTVLYLVAYANIINLIDGLDGLASGISLISCVTTFVLANMAGRLDAAALSIAVVGATLGFLRYNFHPASIFLGDCGSLTLGFALGTVSLLSITRLAGLTTIMIPLVISFVPIVDTLSAIIRRKRAHVGIGHADKGHVHHRLLAEGYDQRQAVLLIYAWTALLCLGAVIMTQVRTAERVGLFCALIGVSFAFAWHLRLFEPVLRHTKPDEEDATGASDARPD